MKERNNHDDGTRAGSKSRRPDISEPLKRQGWIEAGYRCAIPRCMQPTTEIAHIVPYHESKDSSFENLIALCPNHHTLYDNEKKIDRKAIKIIKSKLAIMNGRYGDLEEYSNNLQTTLKCQKFSSPMQWKMTFSSCLQCKMVTYTRPT